jgi:putative restriction endonuclease
MDANTRSWEVEEVSQELEHRKRMWGSLLDVGGPMGVAPKLLRDLGIYGGAQGVWVDKARTASLLDDGTGVTVGLLHTGSSYADDLSDDGVLYHYPSTNRPRGRDLAEIEATKAAGRLGLPVFVITYPSPGSARRDVHLGWVES